MLSKGCKADNFELHNFIKLSFTNIRGLHFSFADCDSFFDQTPMIFLLYVSEAG